MEIYVAEIPSLAGFTSKELDVETSLYHLGVRSYDPWSGRFMETDPLADLSSGESPYIYSNDDPVEFSDPTGNYSYEIDGTPVSQSVGQELQQSYAQNYVLEQQTRQYQMGITVNHIIHNLSTTDKKLLTALGSQAATPYATYRQEIAGGTFTKEIAGFMFTVFNRLASGYWGNSIKSVIYSPGQYDEVYHSIFRYVLTGSDFNSALNKREAAVRWVLNGIIGGSISDPIGGAMFYHSTIRHSGQWDTPPWDDFMFYTFGSGVLPSSFKLYYYGNSIFVNWNGLH